jgi:hypothetical protein
LKYSSHLAETVHKIVKTLLLLALLRRERELEDEGYDRNLPPIGGLGSLATTCFKCHLSRARLVRDGREKEQTLNEEVAGPVAVIQERTASPRPKNDPYL